MKQVKDFHLHQAGDRSYNFFIETFPFSVLKFSSSMFFGLDFKIFLPGILLLIASVDDFRSRKIHNKLILLLLPFVLLAVVLLKGFDGLLVGGFSALLALVVGIPLALARVIGGGDLKLLVLVAFTVRWPILLEIFVYSFPWAFLLGLFKIILDKQVKEFFFQFDFFI